MEIQETDDSVITDFYEFERLIPQYKKTDTHKIYKDVDDTIFQFLKIALEDINDLWKKLDIDKKIKKEVSTFDRYYGDIEDMCNHAKLIQSVRLNVEGALFNLSKKTNKIKGV